MKAVASYQNWRENISVEVYTSFSGKKLAERSIIGLANGVTVNLVSGEVPDCVDGILKAGKKIPESVKWILIEEEDSTRMYILQDCSVNIHTGDVKRDFVLNDAMYKALHGLVSCSSK